MKTLLFLFFCFGFFNLSLVSAQESAKINLSDKKSLKTADPKQGLQNPRPSSLRQTRKNFKRPSMPPPLKRNKTSSRAKTPSSRFNFSGKTKNISFNIKEGRKQGQALKGKTTGVTFDKALPEDISNENFPERIDGFDYPSANLMELTQAVSRLTGLNFIVDPTIKSKTVSIIAPSSITVAEVYKAFLSALASHNFSIVKSGAFWKITTVDKVIKENIEVYSGDYFPNTDQVITRIIKLKYIDADNFNSSIKWLLSQGSKGGAKSHVYAETNSIILSDYGSVIEKIMKIVQEIDIPGSEENIEIIPIKHSSAEELSGILQDLLSLESSSRTRKPFSSRPKSRKKPPKLSPSIQKKSFKGNMQISRIIPDVRTNSLVVSANKAGVDRIHELLEKLDTPVDVSLTGGVYVYHVLHGTAEAVYDTLMGIKPAKKQGSRYPTANSGRGGDFSNRRYSSRNYSSSKQGSSPLFEGVHIMANNNTNSLIISAKNKYDYERVLSVLKKIDIPRDQVFIQAIIMEMIINKADERNFNLGGVVNQLFEGFSNSKIGDLIGSKFANVLGSSVAGFLSQEFSAESLTKGSKLGPGLILSAPFTKLLEDDSSSGGLDKKIVDNINNIKWEENDTSESINAKKASLAQQAIRSGSSLDANLRYSYIPLIRLLKSVDNVNILSTPQLTTLDNEKAHIKVGQDAPVGQKSVATGGGLVTNSQDRQDVSLKLEITPRINKESNTVHMVINQTFDDFAQQASTAASLKESAVHILKREINTQMILRDGETAVLGGLLTDKAIKGESKVPILGDIPILGWLFKGSNVKKEKRNLLVFIMPTIIPGTDRTKTKSILKTKLNERIQFVKKYMKGRDPHGELLQDLIPESKELIENQSSKSSNKPAPESLTDELFSDNNEGIGGTTSDTANDFNIEGDLIPAEDDEDTEDDFFINEGPNLQPQTDSNSLKEESSFAEEEEEENTDNNEDFFIETEPLSHDDTNLSEEETGDF